MTISTSDYEMCGCPHCNHSLCSKIITVPKGTLVQCIECRKGYIVIPDNETYSPFGVQGEHGTEYEKVQIHPLCPNVAPETRPDNGTEA